MEFLLGFLCAWIAVGLMAFVGFNFDWHSSLWFMVLITLPIFIPYAIITIVWFLCREWLYWSRIRKHRRQRKEKT